MFPDYLSVSYDYAPSNYWVVRLFLEKYPEMRQKNVWKSGQNLLQNATTVSLQVNVLDAH